MSWVSVGVIWVCFVMRGFVPEGLAVLAWVDTFCRGWVFSPVMSVGFAMTPVGHCNLLSILEYNHFWLRYKDGFSSNNVMQNYTLREAS